MADESEDKILLNVGLNTEEAEQGITALGQKIDNVAKKDLGTSSVQSYKLQIRELTAELQKIEQVQGRNSQAFRDGAKELGRLKLAAADFKQTIESANPALGKFGALVPIAKGASVALMGAAGAMGLFGIKGEKANEVMLRLQSILALSHALTGVHELTVGYNSLLNVLGLTATAAKKVNVAPGATTTVSSTGSADGSSEVANDEAATAAQTELNAAKSTGTELEVANNEAQATGVETTVAKTAALNANILAQTELNATTAAGAEISAAASEANTAQAVTTGALTVAEEGTTVASVGLKAALWSIGIGLLITAVAYLVSNWDKVTAAFNKLFPVVSQTKSVFQDFQNDLLGVGSAVIHLLKSPIDEAITGIKILIDLLKGDFKAASADFKAGIQQQINDWNVLANFKSGKADGEAKDALAANKVRVQAEIDANTRIIAERKALGQDTNALEIKNQQLKNSLLDKDADDYQKQLADGESAITVLQNTEIKKRLDAAEKLRKEAAEKAAAAKKADLDKLKSGEDEAQKVILEGRRSQRDIELADADFKYQKLIAIAQKYGRDSSQLEEALGITKNRINKKYADEVAAYLEKTDGASLNEFEKKRKQILKESEVALKNANPEESEKINASRDYQLNRSYQEEKLSNKQNEADVAVTNAENANRATVAPEGQGDDPQTVFDKEEAIRKAKLVALQAQYAKEQFLAEGNAEQLAKINADYQKATKDSDDENSKARIALAQAEKDAKIATYETVSAALSQASDLAGKGTVAGKALAVASATISTYLSAQKAYESLIGTPFVGPVLAPIAAATAVAAGLANVKSILSVKVPGNSSSSSDGTTPNYNAPTINSTVLNQAQQGTQNVNVVNQPDTSKQEPVKAFVVDRDISNVQDRAAYLDRMSTI